MPVVGCDAFSGISSGRERKGSSVKLRKDDYEDTEEGRAPLDSQRHTDADTATKTVIPALVSSIPPDATQAIGLISTLRQHIGLITTLSMVDHK